MRLDSLISFFIAFGKFNNVIEENKIVKTKLLTKREIRLPENLLPISNSGSLILNRFKINEKIVICEEDIKIPANISEKTKSKPTKSQTDIVIENNKNLETNINLARMILDKYPDFDPTWNDDVKKSWIDSLTKLYDSLK